MRMKYMFLSLVFVTACAQLDAGDVLNPSVEPPRDVTIALDSDALRTKFLRARELDQSGAYFEASRQYQLVLIENPNLDFVRFRKAYLDTQQGNYLSAQAQLSRLKEIGYPLSLTGPVRELQIILDGILN